MAVVHWTKKFDIKLRPRSLEYKADDLYSGYKYVNIYQKSYIKYPFINFDDLRFTYFHNHLATFLATEAKEVAYNNKAS